MPIYTQAAIVTVTQSTTNFAITHVGTDDSRTVSGGFTSSTTNAFTPLTVGNIFILSMSGAGATGVASGNATWTLLSANGTSSIWYGVATSLGAGGALVQTPTSPAWQYTLAQFTSATIGTWTPGAAAGGTPAGTSLPWAVPSALPTVGAAAAFLYVGLQSLAAATGAYAPGAGYTSLTPGAGSFWSTYNPTITTPATPVAVTSSPTTTSRTIGAYFGAYQTTTGSTGGSVISITPVPMGKSWVMSQIGFECTPASTITTAMATVTFNGRLLFGNTNANGGFVQGPPYVTINAGDNITVNVTGLPVGTSAIINLYYNEYVAGQVPDASNTV